MEAKFKIGDYAYVVKGLFYIGYYGKVIDVKDNKVKVDLEGSNKDWILDKFLYKLTEEEYLRIRELEEGLDLSNEEISILESMMKNIFGMESLSFYAYDKETDDYINKENEKYSDLTSKKSDIKSYIPISEQQFFQEPKFDFNFFKRRWKKTSSEFYGYIYNIRQEIEICLELEDYESARKIGREYAYYMKTLDKKEKEEYNIYCVRKDDWMKYKKWTQEELEKAENKR